MTTLADAIKQQILSNEDRLAAGLQPIPLLDADANLRLKPYEHFCREHGVRSHPARPQTVLGFLRSEKASGTEPFKIALALSAVETLHDHFGYANPVAVAAVRRELGLILNIEAPRSWPLAEQLVFVSLPPEIRAIIARRERERETALRRAQNEAAEAKRQSGSADKPATPNEETKNHDNQKT
jgi:hypothetical protein